MEQLKSSINYIENLQIVPRIYFRDFNKEFDVVRDFCDILGIGKLYSEETTEANVSLSLTSIEAFRRFKRKYVLSMSLSWDVVLFLYEIEQKNLSKIKTFMSFEDRQRVLDFYKPSNENLFREYFDGENLFVLRDHEEEFYKEQDNMTNEKEYEIKQKYEMILEQFGCNLLFRSKIYSDQEYSLSDLTAEFIRGSLIKDYIGGYVEVCNEKIISGWLLDLRDRNPYFVIKLNGEIVFLGKPSIERTDIKEKYGVNINSGFTVYCREIALAKNILDLPEDTELEVEVVHEKTGYVIPGNYRKLLKKEIVTHLSLLSFQVVKIISAHKKGCLCKSPSSIERNRKYTV